MEEEIRRLRELELQAIQDLKHVNNIAILFQAADAKTNAKSVRTAAVHSIRRFFVDYLENNKLSSLKASDPATAKVLKWFKAQHLKFVNLLCKFVSSEDEWLHGISIRTLLELAKWDVQLRPDDSFSDVKMGVATFRDLLVAIVRSSKEVDVDLLLLVKDEIFAFRDCAYFGMIILHDLAEELKQEHADGPSDALKLAMKNILDLLRVVIVPDNVEDGESDTLYLVSLPSVEGKESGRKILDDDSSDDEAAQQATTKRQKRPSSSLLQANKKRVRLSENVTIVSKLRSLDYFRAEFSQTWLMVLSLPFKLADHKLILKHLPKYVVPHLPNPILLADYLTRSYELGGVVAILALESLFQLILNHNLDYPNFFLSLYQLCTVAIFNAKYHGKFLNLLHQSLRSVNLPVYLVAAFIKRLSGIALQCSAPVVQFCIMQIQWLLRHHQQALAMVHNPSNTAATSNFDLNETAELEKSNALSSSLWELEALEQHYLYEVAKSAAVLRGVQSTNPLTHALVIDDSIVNKSYGAMIDADLDKKKKMDVAVSFLRPSSLCSPNSTLGKYFG